MIEPSNQVPEAIRRDQTCNNYLLILYAAFEPMLTALLF